MFLPLRVVRLQATLMGLIILPILVLLCINAEVTVARAQGAGSSVPLGQLPDGTEFYAERSPEHGWELKSKGTTFGASIYSRPVQIEISDPVLGHRPEVKGYDSILKTAHGFRGEGVLVREGGVRFRVEDEWSISGQVL